MSFIRTHLGRLWNFGPAQPATSMDTKKQARNQPLSLSKDSGYSSGTGSLISKDTNASLSQATTVSNEDNGLSPMVRGSAARRSTSDTRYSSTRHVLHKAASSTFKFVSDTIRSKTQLFYVESARPETPYLVESTNAKKERRSRLLLSLRSRSSRSDRADPDSRDSGTTGTSLTSFTPGPDIPHQLQVEIPDANLLEDGSAKQRDCTQVALDDYCISPVMESSSPPHHLALSTVSPISLYANGMGSGDYAMQAKGSLRSDTMSEAHTHQCLLEHESTPHDVSGANSRVNNVDSEGGIVPRGEENDQEDIHAMELSKRSRVGGSLFVKGNREQLRRSGTPSPYKRALRSSESLEVIIDHPSQPQKSLETMHTSGKCKVSFRPTVKRTTSFPRGLSDMIVANTNALASRGRDQVEISICEVYDGDADSSDNYIEEPSMGPRFPWEKARAEREKRYHVLRAMSTETASIGSNESGLELCRFKNDTAMPPSSSPIGPEKDRKVHFEVPEEASSMSTNNSVFKISAKYPAESRASTEYAVETIDKPDRVEIQDDTQSHDRFASHSSIYYAVEAIERPNGTDIDCLEGEVMHFSDAGPLSYRPSQELQCMRLDELLRNSHLLVRPAHNRQSSSISVATAESCAITTSSPLCYTRNVAPSLHVHTTPVRRTSSINEQLHQVRDEKNNNGSFNVDPILKQPELGLVWSLEVYPPSPTKAGSAACSDMEHACYGVEHLDAHKAAEPRTEDISMEPSPPSQIVINSIFKPEDTNLPGSKTRSVTVNGSASHISLSSSLCAQDADFMVEPASYTSNSDPLLRGPRESDMRKWVGSSQEKSQCQPLTVLSSLCGDPSQDSDNRSDTSEILGSEVEASSLWRLRDTESLLESSPRQSNTEGDSDFLGANPELGEYLDQNFSVPPSEDSDAGFRTPLSSPQKRSERAKRESVYSQLQSIASDGSPNGEYLRLHSLKSTYSPLTQTSYADNRIGRHGPSSAFTEQEILRLRDITPVGPDDTTIPLQQDFQTSSVRKGVWWGRSSQSGREEDDSSLAINENDGLSPKSVDATNEVYSNVKPVIQRAESQHQMVQQSIEDIRALLSSADSSESDDGFESDSGSARRVSLTRRHSASGHSKSATPERLERRESTSSTSRKNSKDQEQSLLSDVDFSPSVYGWGRQASRTTSETALESDQGETMVETCRPVEYLLSAVWQGWNTMESEDLWYSF